MGRIASYYYLSYRTVSMFYESITDSASIQSVLEILSAAAEFDDHPVRHGEDDFNEKLSKQVRVSDSIVSFSFQI